MLALNPFGTASPSEASQKAEVFSNAKPCGGQRSVRRSPVF